MFSLGSRYANLPTAVFVDANGREVPYVQMREIPTDVPIDGVYSVRDGDRFDLVAFAAYRDPTQFWRMCDANRGMWPDDLLSRPERLLLVPEPR